MREIQQNNVKKCSENEKKHRKIQNKNLSFESAHVECTKEIIYLESII